jgi:hypothetical protein
MRFAVETWAPEYGVSADASQLELSVGPVDVGMERAEGQWVPLRPAPVVADRRPCLLFVDGVRRIDARIWISVGDVARPGVCASVAAGAVRCDRGRAEVVACEVRRGVFAAAAGAGPVVTRHGTYELFPVPSDDDEGLYLGVHEQMTALEADLSADIGAGADLVVFDGPLRGRSQVNGVGYVKTQHVQYLPDPEQAVVGRLAPGERSPLFVIGGRSGWTRWSWYLRLPGPVAHPLSGVVRCELPGLGTVDTVADRADLVTAVLPAFASQPHKEPRAPQNLYPIGGLERDLRRRLGEAELLERALRVAAA